MAGLTTLLLDQALLTTVAAVTMSLEVSYNSILVFTCEYL